MSGRGGIPAELMRLRQWVVWRAEERDGKPTKVPCIAVAPDQRASSIDPRTWGTYQEARAAVDAGRADGVGFVFSEADPYCGVDLDGMRDPATAALTQAAEQTLSDLDSYSEISPSGSGVHIIVRARLEPGARRRFGSFEVYDRGRFFTMTGLALNGSVIAERQVELDAWHARVFPAPAPIAAPARPVVPVDLADHELLERARRARNGEKFTRLYDQGDWKGADYESQSEADAGLCSMLAYWTGRDPERVDRLFRASALMRPKWDRSIGEGKLYGTTTVMFAVNTTTTVYEPSPAPPPASQPPQRHNPHGERDSGTSASATTTPGVADENGRKPAPGATCGVVAATGAQRGGAELLDDVRAFIARFVVMSNHQRVAVALWAAHTHAMEAAESTPYLDVTSAEKRSGKTRLFETLELLVPRPLRTANISVAALFRLVAEEGPTVFVDEVDAIFKRGRGGDPSQEELRALINAGHRRGAEAVRMVGQGAGMFAKRFPVFGAKALAGIGELPDTIADRGIPIRLRRATPGERRERFRRRRVEPEGHVLRDGLAAWLEPLLDTLVEADPALPEALGDRAADGWEPLFAIADAAGGEWPALAREAAVALADDGQEASDSLGVRLLADIREVFGADDRVTSVNLASRLAALEESPWGDLYGKALDARGLARRLKPYGVSPRTIRLDDGSTPKGYKREQFEDAWARYCPTEGGAS